MKKSPYQRHDESVGRLQEWVRHPALAAEGRGMDEGCDLMSAASCATVTVYFMYDVKQADPAEWSLSQGAEAIAYLETGHAQGKIVITL